MAKGGAVSTAQTKAESRVVYCGCEKTTEGARNGAQFQDERYGNGNRVANPYKEGFSCTICGRRHSTAATAKVYSKGDPQGPRA